jgi:hypothetical protein
MPDHHPKTKTFHLTAIYIKMLFRIFYANVRIRKKKNIARRLQLSSGGLKSLSPPLGVS